MGVKTLYIPDALFMRLGRIGQILLKDELASAETEKERKKIENRIVSVAIFECVNRSLPVVERELEIYKPS